MAAFSWKGNRKRRTRAHVIEEMSYNFFERKVLERSHLLVRAPQREYAWDATLFHFSPNARKAKAMIAHGRLQREHEVIHVVVQRLEDLAVRLESLHHRSRDFR